MELYERVRAGWAADTCDPVDLPWVQVHTADLPPPEASRTGLAVEPMTCPPDAYNSGIDLRVVAPGGTTSAAWTLAAVSA